MPKRGENVTLKNYERKIKSPFIIYADSESILVAKNNRKQSPNESQSYTNKYQKHVACCCYVYKLVCVNNKFSKPFKTYLGKDAAYNFVSSMIKESNYCNEVMKKHLNKELLMTK